MKKLLPLLVVFVVIPGLSYAGKSGKYDSYISSGPDFSTGPLLDLGEFQFSKSFAFFSKDEAWSVLGQTGWDIGLKGGHNPIIRIDSDGDIFLRGKWIAWSARLRNEIRAYANTLR
jgi:hypothetical protein